MNRLFYLVIPAAFILISGSSLKGQDKTTYSLYGFVRAEMFMDRGSITGGDWPLYVPRPDGGNDAKVFSATARHSRIGLKVLNSNSHGFDITGRIEFDFAGGFPNSTTAARQPIIRLRHAWIDVQKNNLSMRMGQDWALISTPFPSTGSFTIGAGSGNLWMRFSQVALRYNINVAQFAFSVNRPMSGNIKYDNFSRGDLDPIDDGERTGAPWIMGRMWLNLPAGYISVSGHYGSENISDLSMNTHRMPTWSLNCSAVLIAGPVKLTGRAFTGENLNSFFGGVFQGFTADSSSVKNVSSIGGWGQTSISLNESWTINIGAGRDDPDDKVLSGVARAKNSWYFANVNYAFGENLNFLMEIDRYSTEYTNGEKPSSTRLLFTTLLTF